MLPDFLKVKEKLKKMIRSQTEKARLFHLGPFAEAPVSMMFEGNKSIIVRENGSVSEMNPREIKVGVEIKLKEIEGMNHEMVLDKINSMAEGMAQEQAELMYGVMNKTAEETGNVASSDGKPFSIDLLLDALEKMHIEFDAEGQPSGLTFVANPKMSSSLEKILSQAADDPRYQALMKRKKGEWRVRESNRKLVG